MTKFYNIKASLLAGVLCIFLFVPSISQVPFVYKVENSGAKYTVPALPALNQLPEIPLLPDPFKWMNGKGRSVAFRDWEKHRNEMRAQVEHYIIGTKPLVDPSQVTASFANDTLRVNVTVNGRTLTLICAVSIPEGAKAPYPVCIGMNSFYGSLKADAFKSRGIVGIKFSHNQVTTYYKAKNTDPFFTLYPERNLDNSGQYAAWVWGVSRIIDGLYKVQSTFPVDLDHIAVTGCSYAGKMALYSGALDERIALTIAQESGGGGATSWRYSHTMPNGTVEKVDNTNYDWFKNSMKTDFSGDSVFYMPIDQHQVMALCAPRALYCTGNTDFTWLSNTSAYVTAMACAKVYSELGIADRFGFHIDGGHGHCAVPASQEPDIAYFLDKFMKGNKALSQEIRTRPADYDTIDYAKWYGDWGK